MNPIKDVELSKIEKNLPKEEQFEVYGEGCNNDCPHRHSWVSSQIGCGTTYDAFISSKR